MSLLAELSNIYTQPTAAAAVLLSIRSRIEFKRKIVNRIGKMFPNGNRGVLFIGKAGVGKSTFLSKLFYGLGLDGVNAYGNPIGKWFSSTGGSTGVGIYQVLEVYNDSIIFADELSLDTEKHVQVIKQIANGELVRPRYGNIESVPFTGLLVGATNAVKLPRNNREMEHLLATLDRFTVFRAKPCKKTPDEIIEAVLSDQTEVDLPVNWKLIIDALINDNFLDLNDNEKTFIKHIWKSKARQILDPTRAQWRNSKSVIDIFLFCKRFFDVPDLTKEPDLCQFASQMVEDCIVFNPIGLFWLSPLEQVIYDCVNSREIVSMNEIIGNVALAGIHVARMTIHRTIARMQENYLLIKREHGKFSTRLPDESYNQSTKQISLDNALTKTL